MSEPYLSNLGINVGANQGILGGKKVHYLCLPVKDYFGSGCDNVVYAKGEKL